MKYRKTPPMWFTRSLLSLCHGYTNPREYTRDVQENTWLKTKPRTSYLCLAYSIFSKDAMEALPGCLRLMPTRDLAFASLRDPCRDLSFFVSALDLISFND